MTDPDLLPQLKAEITFGKAVATFIGLILFFALPIWAIETYVVEPEPQQQTINQGQVAGVASDDASKDEITIPIINQDIQIESQGGALILAGSVLVGVAIVMVLYALVEEQKVKG